MARICEFLCPYHRCGTKQEYAVQLPGILEERGLVTEAAFDRPYLIQCHLYFNLILINVPLNSLFQSSMSRQRLNCKFRGGAGVTPPPSTKVPLWLPEFFFTV
ncbi:hypothetical protein M758_11G091100 [Ceratodon purpureus]|nr:hypothetical protein M758_11G091100 [Ceratodon purpureus]